MRHNTKNSSFCIDMIFALHPNLVMESGVHSSLQENCCHQMVDAKLTLEFIIYFPMNEKSSIVKKQT